MIRFSAALSISKRFWLGPHADHDLEEAQCLLGKAVDRIERIASQE